MEKDLHLYHLNPDIILFSYKKCMITGYLQKIKVHQKVFSDEVTNSSQNIYLHVFANIRSISKFWWIWIGLQQRLSSSFLTMSFQYWRFLDFCPQTLTRCFVTASIHLLRSPLLRFLERAPSCNTLLALAMTSLSVQVTKPSCPLKSWKLHDHCYIVV